MYYLGPYQIKLLKGTRSSQATAERYIVLFTYEQEQSISKLLEICLQTPSFFPSDNPYPEGEQLRS